MPPSDCSLDSSTMHSSSVTQSFSQSINDSVFPLIIDPSFVEQIVRTFVYPAVSFFVAAH